MNQGMIETTVEIFGKPYQIKCAEADVTTLHRAAQLLEEQMVSMRDKVKILSSDKIIVAAALNIAHQLLTIENRMLQKSESFHQRLRDLQNKVDTALIPMEQLELTPAE